MEHKKTHQQHTALENLSGDMAQLRDEFGEMFHTALELGRHYPGELKDQLKVGMKRLKKMQKLALKRGEEAVEGLQETIADRPLTCVAIALGIGVLCGALMRRMK